MANSIGQPEHVPCSQQTKGRCYFIAVMEEVKVLTDSLKTTSELAILVNMIEISSTFWSVWSSLVAEARVLFSLLVTMAILALVTSTCHVTTHNGFTCPSG